MIVFSQGFSLKLKFWTWFWNSYFNDFLTIGQVDFILRVGSDILQACEGTKRGQDNTFSSHPKTSSPYATSSDPFD